jgi:NAD(P)-dependent dehydrogenase (short-subunit alcohol dehydrogenase family)
VKRKSLKGKICLITGAGSGIGRDVAIVAARRGARLILTSQTPAKLESTVSHIRLLGGEVLYSEALDIASYESVRMFSKEVTERFGAVDILINVAGISLWGAVERLDYARWRKVIDINLFGTIHFIENFIPQMVSANKGGHVVNVSSAAGILGMPLHAAYSASKYGIVGITDVLYIDLKPHGIGVSLVCPGAVKTPIMDSTEVVGSNEESRAKFRKIFDRLAIPSAKAAESIVRGIEKNRYLIYTNFDIRVLYLIKANAPFLYRFLMVSAGKYLRRYTTADEDSRVA